VLKTSIANYEELKKSFKDLEAFQVEEQPVQLQQVQEETEESVDNSIFVEGSS